MAYQLQVQSGIPFLIPLKFTGRQGSDLHFRQSLVIKIFNDEITTVMSIALFVFECMK
jgi:hypothetical protein